MSFFPPFVIFRNTDHSNDCCFQAGAGPTGLILAIALARNGVPVRIIEKDAQHHVGQRGAGLMPRTLEVYRMLEVADDIDSCRLSLPIAIGDRARLMGTTLLPMSSVRDRPWSEGDMDDIDD